MSKPYVHALSSVKKWGGVVADYLPLHDWFDQTKAHHATVAHRAVLHNAFGIYLLETVFGHTITNADGHTVHVRDVGEQHVLEDLGFIPSLDQWLRNVPLQPWMAGAGRGVFARHGTAPAVVERVTAGPGRPQVDHTCEGCNETQESNARG